MKFAGGLTIVWLSLCLAHASHALGPLKFGPEFTLSDVQTGYSWKFNSVNARMIKHLIEGQPEGSKFKVELSTNIEMYTFTSPNGWWFNWVREGTDDGNGCSMEFRMIPESVEFYRHYQADIQDAIFTSAALEGIYPALWRGGGHINISRSAFDSRLLLRNFVVDMINHNELFLGIFGYDTFNALSFSLIPARARIAALQVIKQFDRGEILDTEKFLWDLQKAMQIELDPFFPRWGSHLDERGKYFALNLLRHSHEKARIEIRAVRPQASVDVWVRQIDLIAHRLAYLDKIKRPIPIREIVPVKPISFSVAEENHMLNPPVDPQLALRAFYRYVSEAGMKWQDHRDYLWPQWTWTIEGQPSELQKFETSQWFLEREKLKSCEKNLEVAG